MTTTASARPTGLERTYALVERKVGRPLRDTEKAIDILKLDAALERAKDDLDKAIHDEMLRATRAWARAAGGPFPALEITPRMRAVLAELERLGREEGVLELERLGYTGVRKGRRSYAAPDPLPGGGIPEILSTMDLGLSGVRVRLQDELVHADLGAASENAIARALLRVPGGRDIASRVVSTALMSGFGATFEENAALLDDVGDGRGGGWEYSSVLDGGTCQECAPMDGKVYATWEDVQVDLPGGGPYPKCRGGGRCRCRAVPLPPGDVTSRVPMPSETASPPPPVGERPDVPFYSSPQKIWRASDSYVGEGSHWAESRVDAEAYLDNPGYGGASLFSAEIDPPRDAVLDLVKSRSEWTDLADAAGYSADDWDDDGNSERDRVIEQWRDTATWPYEVWEERSEVLDRLRERGLEWIRYEDTYPNEAVVLRMLHDRPLGATSVRTEVTP